MVRRSGLDRMDLEILEVLYRKDSRWSEIRDATGLGHVQLYRRLKRLEKMGLIMQKERKGPWGITESGKRKLRERLIPLKLSEAELSVKEVHQREKGRKEYKSGEEALNEYLSYLIENEYAEIAVLEILNLLYVADLAFIEEVLYHKIPFKRLIDWFSQKYHKQLRALYTVLNLPDERWIEGKESFKELLKHMWSPIAFDKFRKALEMRKSREGKES